MVGAFRKRLRWWQSKRNPRAGIKPSVTKPSVTKPPSPCCTMRWPKAPTEVPPLVGFRRGCLHNQQDDGVAEGAACRNRRSGPLRSNLPWPRPPRARAHPHDPNRRRPTPNPPPASPDRATARPPPARRAHGPTVAPRATTATAITPRRNAPPPPLRHGHGLPHAHRPTA